MNQTTIYGFTTNGVNSKIEVAGAEPGRDNVLSHIRALDRLAAEVTARADGLRRTLAERDAEDWA